MDGLTLMIQVSVLHLERHDFLFWSMGQIVGGCALRATPPVDIVSPLVFLVVQGSESQDVQKQQRCPHGDGDTQLCGVVPLIHREGTRLLFGIFLFGSRKGRRDRCGIFPGRSESDVCGWHFCCCRSILRNIIEIMQMRYQLQPEIYLIGSVMLFDSWF